MVILCECYLVDNMAEYPPRSCGPCPYLAQFAGVQDKKPSNSDHYALNTVPDPKVRFQDTSSNLTEVKLGVPSTTQNPDLTVSPIKSSGNLLPRNVEAGDFSNNNGNNGKAEQCIESCLGAPKEPKNTGSCCPPPKDIPPYPTDKPAPTASGTKLSERTPQKTEETIQIKGILKNNNISDTSYKTTCCCGPNNTKEVPKGVHYNTENMHAAAGRVHPDAEDPSKRAPVPNDLRPVPPGQPPCYMPQPEDFMMKQVVNEMGPTGTWATGKADWGPLAGLTGTRPVVDKYSITRYSEGEWRGHNKEVLDRTAMENHRAHIVDWNSRQCLEQTQADVDKNQEDNTKRLTQRHMEILRWKCELERAITAASDEIGFMEEQRQRLKTAAAVLQMPESIAGECLERRTGRLDSELVRDEVEEELIKELSLCAEIRDIFARTLGDVEKQLLEDKTAKQRLEYDWSDKRNALEIDATNVALNTRSTVLLFKPGAVIFPENQSTAEYWQHFTKETLLESEATRQRSAALRGTLDAILINASRDLRTQADKVELALAKRIACAEEVTRKLEQDLKEILRRLAEVEELMIELRAAIRRMDTPMKKAQTRLDNRLLRPRVENCRDAPHFGLIEEVKSIGENVAALQAQLNQADKLQTDLTTARNNLEREIMMKRKTLEIDADRTKRIRSYYPSASALAGH